MRQPITSLLFSAVLILSTALASSAAIIPGKGAGWLIVGSQNTLNKAIKYAQNMSGQHKHVLIFASNNGWFGISLGWAKKNAGSKIKKRLLASGAIPSSSYFHTGERFLKVVWSSNGNIPATTQALLAATQIGNASNNNSQPTQTISSHANGPAYVAGLNPNGDNYLSLRAGPNRKRQEVGRLSPNTQLSIIGTQGKWHQVQLPDGRSGWAFGKYITSGFAPPPKVEQAGLQLLVQEPTPEPEKAIIVDETESGTKVEVAGLGEKGFDYIALRKGPSDTYLVVARLRDETKLVVTGKSDGWYRVRPAPTVEGWIQAEYVIAPDVQTFGPDEEASGLSTQEQEVAALEPDETTNPTKIPTDMGRRVALILGNSAYTHTVKLANPKNDAESIAAKLTDLGFEVIIGLDGTKSKMETSIREFVRILPGAEVALFFYAGHAMQIGGANHLIPVDAKLEDSTAVDFETIKLSSILDFIDEPGRISIALLDACRDNPLSRSFAKAVGATRSAGLGRGLASPISAGNLLIGFATAPGEVALDGEGANSPFTSALLKHIDAPNTEVETMLKRVRAEVFNQTNQQQSPWVNSALRKDFYFKPQ